MSKISTNLIESLKTMGLTEYEAKVYSALVLFERAEVKKIYEYLNMPKPSVYQSLKGLMDKGLVMLVSSKPAIYRAIPPKIAIKHLLEVHKNAEENALLELEHLEKSSVETESPDIIWTLFGQNNVELSLEELICKVKKSMKLVLPDDYIDLLSFLEGKNIEIKLLMFGKDASIATRYGLKNLTVHDAYGMDTSDFGIIHNYFKELPMSPKQLSKLILVSIDNEEFVYIRPFPGKTKTGINTKNHHFIGLMNIAFSIIWDHTPEVPLE
jgi:predicted DNA-binding transcriptional regulator